ncbi:MAG: efflux RND transporter periplasmic adaptor subunit [Armatimonadota bacterium]|nr:efflux RND transporter periplasmic adaptor subunit [Armatimonadota bacterium]
MKNKLVGIALVAAVMVGVTTLSIKMSHKPKVETQAEIRAEAGIPVVMSEVRLGPIEDTLQVTGNVKALTAVNLSAKAPGRVAAVMAREGDSVGAGQTLIMLDQTEAQSQVRSAGAGVSAARARLSQAITMAQAQEKQSKATIAQAQAALRVAQAHLDVVRKGARTQERLVAQNAVDTAKANLDNAEANYKRYKTLHDRGAVSAQQLDTYKTQYDIAKAQYDSAKQQLSLIQEGARPEDIEAAEGQFSQAREALRMARANASQVDVRWEDVKGARAAVSQAEAALAAARQQLAYTSITSTVSGVVSSREVEPGQTATPGMTLMAVVDLRSVYFEANVSESDFEKVRIGRSVSVTIDALPGRSFSGIVAKILPVASPASRDFKVQAQIPNRGGDLRPGMFARGNVLLGLRRSALLVPKDAIDQRHGDTVVFTVREVRPKQGAVYYEAKVKPISVGMGNTEVVEALPPTDLVPGEQVVVTGHESLQDGVRVHVSE